ncbi:hypothetical protein BH11PLA2_BH11PLA2_14120 [soil metagenome]
MVSLQLPKLALSWNSLRVHPYTAGLLIASLALAAPFATRKVSEWDGVFIPTAQHLVHGEDIYEQAHGYVYPPLQAVLALPVLGLSSVASRLAWFVVNGFSLWFVLRSVWRFAGGPDLETVRSSWREHLAFNVGLIVGLTYFFNSLMHQQTDILLAAILFAGCERINTGRGLKAAICFGIAAAMKCTPLLFAPYLAVRGKFLAAATVLIVATAASLLPDLVNHPQSHSTWVSKWFAMFLAPMASTEHRPGVWASDIVYNQSLIGGINRWTGTTWAWEGNAIRMSMIEPLLKPTQMKLLILGIAVVLGLISLAAIIVARRRGVENATPWECSLVLSGMLLFSPMSSPAHFGVLLLPAWLLARRAFVQHQLAAGVILAGMLLAAAASNKDLLGGPLYTIGLWQGSVMACAIMALVGAWWGLLLDRNPRSA